MNATLFLCKNAQEVSDQVFLKTLIKAKTNTFGNIPKYVHYNSFTIRNKTIPIRPILLVLSRLYTLFWYRLHLIESSIQVFVILGIISSLFCYLSTDCKNLCILFCTTEDEEQNDLINLCSILCRRIDAIAHTRRVALNCSKSTQLNWSIRN
jgi:hypothetical protein